MATGRRAVERDRVTRLLGQHPTIDVELDLLGRRRSALARHPRAGRGLQPLANRGSLVAPPLLRDYYKVVGTRLLALVYLDGVDGTWHLERLYD